MAGCEDFIISDNRSSRAFSPCPHPGPAAARKLVSMARRGCEASYQQRAAVMEWRNRHLQSCSPVHAAAHHSYCRMYPTIHCSCPDTEKSIPTRHYCHYYLLMASIEMWHVVLLIVSETCVEWRNLGGFRSRVRCPCPQLAAAQWWEAAGRGISCSNYVRCIATLCL